MKKIFLLFLLLIASDGILQARNVTLDNARKAGINFYFERINRVSPVDFTSIQVKESFTVLSGDEPVYYAFNFRDGGFIIVSADDAVTPVLGYSFEGEYSEAGKPPQYITWMEGYARQIDYCRNHQLAPEPGVAEAWQHLLTDSPSTLKLTTGTRDVAPLLTSTWDQGSNYNNLCPADPMGPGGHVWAGCVATAMCQLMYYYRYPLTGQGSHCYTPSGYPQQCADFGNTEYKWNEMLNSHGTPDTATLILLWHAGIAVDMMYSAGGSGAYSQDAATAMVNYFRYNPGTELLYKDNYSEAAWDSILMYNLDNKHPLYYQGFGTAGHAFNVDGYQGSDYFHFNWGWSGSYNGYFYLDNLNPGGNIFNYGQGAIVNCYPDKNVNTYPYFCSGQTVLTTLRGTFEDGSGPEDYRNNGDCSWLIQPLSSSDSITKITLSFSRFSTEEGSDVVNIYAGSNATSTPVASYSGDNIPSNLVVTGNQAYVTFTTNGTISKPGWFISYFSETMNWCTVPVHYTDKEGTFSDGSFHFNYKNFTNCRWIIEPSDTGAVILDFTSFNTQADHDFVKVFDFSKSELLASYSGNYDENNLPEPVVSKSGKMFVLFVTDGTVTDQGWEAHYKNVHVGIEEKDLASEIVLYPNPASEVLNIRFPDLRLSMVRAELISTDGKTLLSSTLSNITGNETRQLDVSRMPSGIYFLRLVTDRSVVTKKLIIE